MPPKPALSRRAWLAGAASLVTRRNAHASSRDYPQRSADVSRVFEAAENVEVTRITDSPFGNQLSYYDIPCYAPAVDRIVYNTVVTLPPGRVKQKVKPNKGSGNPEGALWGVVSCRLDGSDSRLLLTRLPATSSTVRADMSQDGKLVTYTRANDAPDSGWDLYGFRLGDGRSVEEFRITRLRSALGLTTKVKTSPPTWDPKAERYLCAFSIDDTAWLVYDDGKAPGGGAAPVSAGLTDLIDFPNRRDEDTSFHRIRLNPIFAHLLYFRRNGVSDNWLMDLSQPHLRSRRINDFRQSIHASWSPDGRIWAGSLEGLWKEWPVADAVGRALPELTPRDVGPFGHGGRPGVFYGAYSSDNRLLAVATRYDQDPGGSLWLMNRSSGKTTYLCKVRCFGPTTAGQPRLGFIDHDCALVFSTDNSVGAVKSDPPQLYTVRSPLFR